MVCGHLLLPLPPTHSKYISVKHLLTSHHDFAHLKNCCCKSVKVNGLRPHTDTLCGGTIYLVEIKHEYTVKECDDLSRQTSKANYGPKVMCFKSSYPTSSFYNPGPAKRPRFCSSYLALLGLQTSVFRPQKTFHTLEAFQRSQLLSFNSGFDFFFFPSAAVHRPQFLYLYN